MMRSIALTMLAGAAIGCTGDSVPFNVSLVLENDDESSQACPSNVCSVIPMTCNATVLVRVVDASNPNTVYVSECFAIDGGTDLCTLASVNLGDEPIPNTRVRIQFAVWPRGIADDCPRVEFDLGGKASITQPDGTPMPAIAGATYFEVGSSEQTDLVLGCIDWEDLNDPSCSALDGVHVLAGVVDFDTNVSVSPTVQNLIVSVGEPVFDGSVWSMPTADTVELDRDVVAGIPIWANPVEEPLDLEFQAAACIQVFEDGLGPVTATVACRPASPDDTELTLGGVLVRKATVDLVQEALGGSFPPGGLVLGRVVDHTGQPAQGVTIVPSQGTVQYLSDDMASLVGGGVTSSSGAFVSMDAPFDTTWEAATIGTAEEVEIQLGGRITGKVTVIELQLTEPVIDPPS